MEGGSRNGGGVDRSHGRTLAQRAVFCLGHLAIVLCCAWLVCGGLERIGGRFGQTWGFAQTGRAALLVGCAGLYWLRHAVTLFYLLARRVDWPEVLGLLAFLGLIEVGLLLAGGGLFNDTPPLFRPRDGFALALVLAGSYLNTASETQRELWKRDPANRGRCYTGGLFKYSMHINYFGDTVMFTGWALLTAVPWALVLPALMAAMFVGYHIPALDAYLAERYPNDFPAYARTTRKFIPFIY
jgi:protein-S-isoprenylcysteine O-methyltransferase Ste14